MLNNIFMANRLLQLSLDSCALLHSLTEQGLNYFTQDQRLALVHLARLESGGIESQGGRKEERVVLALMEEFKGIVMARRTRGRSEARESVANKHRKARRVFE